MKDLGVWTILLAAHALAGCSAESLTAQSPTSGAASAVAVIQSHGPVLPPTRYWSINGEPILEIGSADGTTGALLFGWPRALRLDDGMVVVANGGREIMFFDSGGALARTVGGLGGGPGEFLALEWIGATDNDMIAAWDSRARRISLFARDGRFVRSETVREDPGATPRMIGAWDDGTMLGTLRVGGTLLSDQLTRDTLIYALFGPDGRLTDTVGRFPNRQFYQIVVRDGNRISTSGVAPPFLRIPQVALTEGGFAFGLGDDFSIHVFSRQGVHVATIRWDRPLRRVTPAMIQHYHEQLAEGASNEQIRRAQQRMLERVPMPTTLPAYDRFLGDEVGNLWVREYQAPGDAEQLWHVFDIDGRLLGPVRLPLRFEPAQAGDRFVLGVWRDPDDVPYVRMYALLKP